jgi:TfoX/Sxy family transcriptional regulator of competence genes
MAYDQGLAERLRALLDGRTGVTEKAMFGGVCFLLHGKMFVGIVKDELMVRVGEQAHDDAIRRPHARVMDFTGRPMRGYVFVAPEGFEEDDALARWVEQAHAHAGTLPEKKARSRSPATKRAPPDGRTPPKAGTRRT